MTKEKFTLEISKEDNVKYRNDIKEDLDEDAVEAVYTEAIRLYNLQMGSYDALTSKTNGIIIFAGATLALITSAFIQLIIFIMATNKIPFLIVFIILPYAFLISSLIIALYSYKTAYLPAIDAEKFRNKYYNKSKVEIMDHLSTRIAKHAQIIRKGLGTRGMRINISLYLLFIGIFAFAVVLFYMISFKT